MAHAIGAGAGPAVQSRLKKPTQPTFNDLRKFYNKGDKIYNFVFKQYETAKQEVEDSSHVYEHHAYNHTTHQGHIDECKRTIKFYEEQSASWKRDVDAYNSKINMIRLANFPEERAAKQRTIQTYNDHVRLLGAWKDSLKSFERNLKIMKIRKVQIIQLYRMKDVLKELKAVVWTHPHKVEKVLEMAGEDDFHAYLVSGEAEMFQRLTGILA